MHQTVNKEPVVTLDPTDGTRFPGAVSANPAVWVNGVDIAFGDFTAVQGIDLDVRDGEFLCLLGPSGCGKSTLLSVMAGFKQPAAGKLARHGNPINGAGPEMGYVFQSSDALFDWLSVADNVGFGPRMANLDKHERDRAVKDHLALVGLEHAAALRPPQLSGGMRQRVQIARVLANNPDVVLMDEPFGALDAQTRTVMQHELDRIWRDRQCTVVFVTHDIDEALILSDRIAVMTAGPAASIKSVYDVDLPRPRDEENPDYIDLRHRVRDDITEEVAKSLGRQSKSVS